MDAKIIKSTPWLWVPTLYFAEGIPYFIVNNILVLMLTKMGVANDEMSFFTSLIYLPWVIKPFWSPFVDILRSKRWWIVSMQVMMSAVMLLIIFSIPRPEDSLIAMGHTPVSMFYVMLGWFVVMAFASATHDIAADGFYMLALTQHEQSAFVGIRSTFYRISMLFGQGVLVYVAGVIEERTGDVPLSWRVAMICAASVFALITVYHLFFIPRPKADQDMREHNGRQSARQVFAGFAHSFSTFFGKPGVWLSIVFMLLYRLPEAFLVKLCTPFLLAGKTAGGLGLATEQVGIVYGTIGAVALTAGGILGGLFAARVGLRRALWLMAASITLPDLVYVYFAAVQPDSMLLITALVAVEQFGYGFGFTAYMLYMMYFSEGDYKTSHYAICTAFMALSMMLPGLVAGWIQVRIGYEAFFWVVMLCCLVTLAVTWVVSKRVRADYGKK
ncbi:MAG: MFS transporter [Paludibacteraceae bacterium]|nr:MFS transporter [Paludibacteraceae bacterium]